MPMVLSSPQGAFVHGQLINLVRTGRATTRPALEKHTGLGRKVVAQRVQQAIDVGLLEAGDLAPSAGGRPSRMLRLRSNAGHVYAGVIGATELSAAVSTLDGTLIASAHEDHDTGNEPRGTLEMLDRMFGRLGRRTRTEPWAFGIGIAGPVEFSTGTLVAPPIMPAWEGFNIRTWFRERYDASVWVDNDVNTMALGEWHRGAARDSRDLLYVLMDTGIGAGLVSAGTVFRGDRGAAGDIGHIRVTDDPDVLCRCERTGCLEALAGGWGLVERLTLRAHESPFLDSTIRANGRLSAADIGRAAAAGDNLALSTVLEGARTVAATVANLVSFANPGTIVLGGGALRVGPRLVDTFEEVVRRRVSDLAGRDLTIRPASLDFSEGLVGAAHLAIECLFEPASLGAWVDNGSPIGHAALLHRTASA